MHQLKRIQIMRICYKRVLPFPYVWLSHFVLL